jgi:hypothetical protein
MIDEKLRQHLPFYMKGIKERGCSSVYQQPPFGINGDENISLMVEALHSLASIYERQPYCWKELQDISK